MASWAEADSGCGLRNSVKFVVLFLLHDFVSHTGTSVVLVASPIFVSSDFVLIFWLWVSVIMWAWSLSLDIVYWTKWFSEHSSLQVQTFTACLIINDNPYSFFACLLFHVCLFKSCDSDIHAITCLTKIYNLHNQQTTASQTILISVENSLMLNFQQASLVSEGEFQILVLVQACGLKRP